VADTLSFTQPYIDGLPVDGASEPLGVEDPAIEEIFTTVPTASPAQVDAAIDAARRAYAQGVWSRQPVRERTAALARMADALAGNPRNPETVVGPVNSAAQRERVERLVAEGVEAGGTLIAGGEGPPHLDVGYYVAPTVVAVEDNRNPLAQREVFGPVVTIQGYDDLDHAVEITNDSEYGLSAGVCTPDLNLGPRIAGRSRTGTVQVNRGAANAYTPMGGVKQSGIGRERGVAGFCEYQELKHVVLTGAR
jgi:acyl-CoA reductase-like NAD-dependent aldehyde dehydrogenase